MDGIIHTNQDWGLSFECYHCGYIDGPYPDSEAVNDAAEYHGLIHIREVAAEAAEVRLAYESKTVQA